MTGDVTAQVEAGTRPPDEIAVDFHYRMVSIHVFPNANGHYTRLSAALFAGRLGREAFTWRRADLTDPGETRATYVGALEAADGFDCTRRSKSRPLERRRSAVAGGVKPGQW
jgi:Fic family protein